MGVRGSIVPSLAMILWSSFLKVGEGISCISLNNEEDLMRHNIRIYPIQMVYR